MRNGHNVDAIVHDSIHDAVRKALHYPAAGSKAGRADRPTYSRVMLEKCAGIRKRTHKLLPEPGPPLLVVGRRLAQFTLSVFMELNDQLQTA